MRADHHMVEALDPPGAVANRYALRRALNLGRAALQADASGQALCQLRDLGPAANHHRAPFGSVAQFEQAVVVEEADEGFGGVVEQSLGRSRPYGTGHGQEMQPCEVGAKSPLPQIVAERKVRGIEPSQVARRLAVE